MKKSEEKWEVKAQVRRGNVPLVSRRWMPLLEWVVLELESSNPKRALRLRDGGGTGLFLG